MIKTGQRMSSSVCDTEVMVIRAGDGSANLECGGAAMAVAGTAERGGQGPDAGSDGGTTIGKRYVHEASGVEVLCVKAGAGSLGVDGTPMALLEGKKLPSSD